MFAKATKSRFFAVFAVMMLMLCSVAVIADADASPYGGITENEGTDKAQKFTVDMSVGQTFTYTSLTTNLDGYGSIKYSWAAGSEGNSAIGSIALNEDEKKLTGSFSTSGTYSGILTATWTGPSAGTDGKTPTQKATQEIIFEVDEKIVITPVSVTGYALVGWDTSKQILEISYTGSTDVSKDQESEVVTASYTYGKDGDGSASDVDFTASHNLADKKIIVTPKAKLTDKDADSTKAGPQYINVTLTNPNTQDKDTVQIELYIYDEIAITSETTHYYTYEGDDTYTKSGFVFKVNYDGDNDDKTVTTDYSYVLTPTTQSVLTVNPDATDATAKKTVGISTAFSKSGDLVDEGAVSKDYTAKLTVTGKVNDDTTLESTATSTFTLTVYKSLEFTSAPKTTGTVAKAISTGSNNTMSLSTSLSGAKYVTINWGDGQISKKAAVSPTSSLYSAQHTYANSGMYMITITAENDVGTTTSKVLYAVDSTLDVTPDTTDSDKKTGFFEEHGYLFLVFILILVGLLVAYFYFGIQHPFVLLLAIVCAVLAVALYVYGDFGGIIDALKGSK